MEIAKVSSIPIVLNPDTIYLRELPGGEFDILVSSSDGNEVKSLHQAQAPSDILAQELGVEDTNTSIYTVPSNIVAKCSKLVIVNNSLIEEMASVYVKKDQETLSSRHIFVPSKAVSANGSLEVKLGFNLSTGDEIIVNGTSGDLVYMLLGEEVSL